MAALGLGAPAWADCNGSSGPCRIAEGSYHATIPFDGEPSMPVVVFLHGAGSNGAGVLGNKRLLEGLTTRGYAVLAPTGSHQFGQGKGRSWNFFPGWDGRDEVRFLGNVVSDAATRFDLDPSRVLLAGFSAGGFMAYYLACAEPERFAAYASVAGGFWRPHPSSCTGPVRLHHTHGWADRTVPLEGRFLAQGRYQQGDIFHGMEIWRKANACPDERPDTFAQTDAFLRRSWTECAAGGALELALFPGGHTVPEGWAGLVLDWFENLPETNE